MNRGVLALDVIECQHAKLNYSTSKKCKGFPSKIFTDFKLLNSLDIKNFFGFL